MLPLLALGVALAGPVPSAIERSVQERMGDVRVVVLAMKATGVPQPHFQIPSPGSRVPDPGSRLSSPESRIPSLDVARDALTLRQAQGHPEPGRGLSDSRRADPGLNAAPEPGSRLGRPIRFILFAGRERVGSVVATLEVSGEIVRARTAIPRGEAVGSDDIEITDVELKDVMIRRLPAAAEVEGAEARRDIRAGEVLTDAVLSVPPVVRSGDEVTVTVRAGAVTVTGVGHASGSGRAGDFIRVLLPSSRKGLKARITGPGSVELIR